LWRFRFIPFLLLARQSKYGRAKELGPLKWLWRMGFILIFLLARYWGTIGHEGLVIATMSADKQETILLLTVRSGGEYI